MKIQLESGNVITTGPVKGIGNGSQVEISFDFTKNKVRNIWLKGERNIIEPVESPKNDINILPKIDLSMVGVFSTREWGIEGWEGEEE